MAIDTAFNVKAREVGYGKSDRAVQSSRFSEDQNPHYINPIISAADIEAFNKAPSPIMDEGEQQPNTVHDLAEQSENNGNIMDVMYPDRNYEADASGMNPTEYMFDPNKPVTNIDSATSVVGALKTDLNEKHAQFTEDFKQARGEAIEALKESANNLGLDAGMAEKTMVTQPQSGMAGAAAVGAGSLVTGPTVGVSATACLELSKDQKKLSPDEQKSVMEDMLKSLQASRQSPEAQQESNSAAAVSGDDVQSAGKSEVAWENMTVEDIAHLIDSPHDGSNQEIFKDHELGADKIAQIENNWDFVRDSYGDNVTGEKMYALEESGNGAMTEILRDAEEVQFDATHMSLTGDFLASVGGKVAASEVTVDTKEIATALNHDKIDYNRAGQELNNHIDGLRA
ncbi:MAG: hypothetical protein KAJ29_02395 [Alphaproteobacteria bacterium]|nr:hypothetical protein [Alphaproteobacteria bacterium]